MCGIVGFWNKDGAPAQKQNVTRMTDSIRHRGPDAEGYYVEGALGLGHRRLSILDLSEAGNQPFYSPCNNFILVFNGEIFNYKTFYPELRAKGYTLNTTTDTEVLLYLLMEYGISVLSRLNGFFSFAFWNRHNEELTLVRDRFGVKPLFYCDQNDVFYFASEPKALFRGGVKKELNEAVLGELFFYRYVSGENTVFSNVLRLLPGHLMVLKEKGKVKKIIRWFKLSDEARNKEEIKNPLEWFESTFHESIRYRMISDVPVGTLLSGGLDSSSVLFSQFSQKFENLSSWNVQFKNYKFDESTQARKLSEIYGVDFNSKEFVNQELVNLVKESMINHDEPLMHLQDGHLLGLAKMAKKKVSVLLSGEGADEVLGGYVRYKVHDKNWRYSCLQALRYIPIKYLRAERLKKMKRYLQVDNLDMQFMSNSNELFLSDLDNLGGLTFNIISEHRVQMLREAREIYPKNRFRQLLYLEQHTHLQTLNDRNDRTTMGASIECRDPFLDPNLVVGVASLEDKWFSSEGKGKVLLANSVGKKLPEFIQKHPKIGLSVPWDRYFLENSELRAHLEGMHLNPLFKRDLFAQMNIQKIVEDFKKDQCVNYGLVRQLFFLSFWYKTVFTKDC